MEDADRRCRTSAAGSCGRPRPSGTGLRPTGLADFPAEAGRYHLYVSWACPWAHRTTIMRKVKGLEEVVSLSGVEAHMGENGWVFSDGSGEFPDPLYGATFLRDIYTRADPGYTGRVTTPVLWDRESETIVNNESREIINMLDTEFGALATADTDFYPDAAARRDRRRPRRALRAGQQRRLPVRLRQPAGGLRGGRHRALRRPRRMGGGTRGKALPVRGYRHRGRLGLLHDARPVR